MNKVSLILFALCSASSASTSPKVNITNHAAPPTQVLLSHPIDPKSMPFISHKGPGAFDNALALNIPYEPIKDIRSQLEQSLGGSLNYLKSWAPNGEAHVTTITPPEFANVLGKFLTMKEIEDIALKNQIQHADVVLLGLGAGKKMINGIYEETFFVIVDSLKLRHIRNQIWRLYVNKGGDPKAWDPSWFFPHITVGYTKQDLHEPDVIKNIRGSLDTRFALKTAFH
ncbi:MAG TPA: hypothetical protein VM901_07545 [Bdellovibrionota bacterium]|jgi:hypothetical protein|nr:hypothetical protein [Bdellovibrionota bacterium]